MDLPTLLKNVYYLVRSFRFKAKLCNSLQIYNRFLIKCSRIISIMILAFLLVELLFSLNELFCHWYNTSISNSSLCFFRTDNFIRSFLVNLKCLIKLMRWLLDWSINITLIDIDTLLQICSNSVIQCGI
jgi:hypothetical protein